MLAVITKLDGANVALFHMEHFGNRKWEFQLCWPGSHVAEFRDWSPPRPAAGELAVAALRDPNVTLLARWRWADDFCGEGEPPPEEPWQDGAPHEWGDATCEFHVIVSQPRDFQKDPHVQACALVRGIPVSFALLLPRRKVALEAPECFTLTGSAIGCGPGTVLREPGEFVSTNDAFSISNAAPSQATLLPVPAKVPESLPLTDLCGVRTGILPPEEIEMLRRYVAEQEALKTANPATADA